MKRILGALSISTIVSLLICATVWAQATAQISGTVRDQSGAVLPGVEVIATQTETGISRSSVLSSRDARIMQFALKYSF